MCRGEPEHLQAESEHGLGRDPGVQRPGCHLSPRREKYLQGSTGLLLVRASLAGAMGYRESLTDTSKVTSLSQTIPQGQGCSSQRWD